jgi:hypothetical protein
MTYSRQVALCDYSRPCIQAQLHFRNLLIYILHELNDEIDEFVLQHGFTMEVGDQERDIVSLQISFRMSTPQPAYRQSLPSQNHKPFRTHHHEPCKLVT